MEQLPQATENLICKHGSPRLCEHLSLIAKHASKCLKYEVCEIYLRKGESVFSLEAGYGHPEGRFQKGKLLTVSINEPIHRLLAEDLTDWPLAPWADALKSHSQFLNTEAITLTNEKDDSLLALPIVNKDGREEHLLGFICVRGKNDTVDDTQQHVGFRLEDKLSLRPFADAIGCAVEFAAPMIHAEQLIAGAPFGIITIDSKKVITGFNSLAQELFKYEAEEVLGKPVRMLCDNPADPDRIFELIHSVPNGKTTNYETYVRSSKGERIPVRLEATWLPDAWRGHPGLVIYLSDLRAIRKAERNLTHILNANEPFADAEGEAKSLHFWAEMFVHLLKITFCRIFLIDETQECLVPKAVHPISRAGGLDWWPGLEKPTAITEWPRMLEFLRGGTPTFLSVSGKTGRKLLSEWSTRLKLKSKIQTLLVIPLKTENGLIGLLDLGELRTVERSSFSQEKQELATAMANQLALIIDQKRLHKETEHRRQLLTALAEKSLYLRSSKETDSLLKETVRLAAELVGCTAGGLYIFDEHLQEMMLKVVHKIPLEFLNSRATQDESLIGLVMREGKPKVIYDYSRRMNTEDILKSSNFQTVAAVPVKQAGRVAAVLFVADSGYGKRITEGALDVLERFASHASMAWQISRLIGQEQRMFTQLASLHGISDYIEAAQDVDTVLGVLLTGITAGYGLGFNRAAVFLFDELREQLIGRAGIGHLEESEAQKDWELHNKRGLEDFAEYLKQREQGCLTPSPIADKIPGLRLPLNLAATDLCTQIIRDGSQRVLVSEEEIASLPRQFVEVFEPAAPAIAIPLVARKQILGLLIADTKFTQSPISKERVDSLTKFINTSAIAIDNITTLKQARGAKERLQGLFQARNALIPSKDPEAVLQDVVDQILLAADASWVRLILISEAGKKQSQIDKIAKAGNDKELDYESIIRPGGISMTVLSKGVSIAVEDTAQRPEMVSQTTLEEGSRAYVCLPFAAQEKPVGVIWLHYDTPRKFPDTELDALHLYANHAADVYASSRKLKHLENLRKVADDLAEANSTENVLHRIVRNAVKVLNADSAVLWYYDSAQDSFIPEYSIAVGIQEEMWTEMQKEAPRKKGTAYAIMEGEWLSVGNINDVQQCSLLDETTLRMLCLIKAQAVQCVALSVGKEMLGVLYANYKSPQLFGEEDRSIALSFAYHATLVLKKSKLLDQVSEAKEWAYAGAKVTVLHGRSVALKSIAEEAKKMSGCDAVAIFEYDRKTRRLTHPPTMLGVWDEKEASKADEVLRGSLVYTMLGMREAYFAEDVGLDKHFKERRFSKDEKIKSCLALPLRFAGEEIGVMFLNYRSARRITTEELKNIELYANQSAVAIHNTQVFEERTKGLSIQESLVDLSRKFLSTVSSEETLKYAVAVAARELCEVCSILSPNRHGVFSVRAIARAPESEEEQPMAGAVNDGVAFQPIHLPENMYGMCVPIHKEGVQSGRVIGVVQVHTTGARHFSSDELTFLSLVANQTAIALQSAQWFEEVERQRSHLEALNKASKAITWSLGADRRRILNDIMQLAYTCVNSIAGHNAILSTIQIYDKPSNKLIFEGIFPLEEYPRVLRGLSERYSISDRLPLDRALAPQGKIGITGRAVEQKKPQLINNVLRDPDYIIFDSRTRSELAVPLIEQNKVLGVFNVESDQVDGFDRADLETLQGLAELAIIAIDNASLYQQEEQRVRLMEAIADISQIINASLDLNATLKAILQSTKKLIVYTAAEINFWEENKQGTVVFESDGYPGYTQKAGAFYARGEGFTGQIIMSRQSLLIENTEDFPNIYPKVTDPDKPIRSFVGVPLLISEGDRNVGTLELVSHEPNKYSGKDKDILERIGLLATVAIKKAERAKKLQSAAYAAAMAAQAMEIAHGAKSEAGAILRKLYILQDRYELPVGVRDILKEIEGYTKSLIPQQVHNYGTINTYKPNRDRSGTELDSIISTELTLAEKRWTHVTINKALNAEGLKVNINEHDLKHLLRHLLQNSAKAIKSASGFGKIFVRTSFTESFAFLQVGDDGPGIPDELKSKILRVPIDKEDGIVGWGLFMVRLTVERNDGSVQQVKSQSSKGTCFELRFPIVPAD